MKREIKYKLYDSEGNHIGYETHVPNEWGVYQIYHQSLRDDFKSNEPMLVREGYFIPHTYKCQFSGIPDRNGVDVYEGDIVEVKGRKRTGKYVTVIVWDRLGFKLEHNDTYWNDHVIPSRSLTVLGNIHQHPHLLTNPKTK